MPTKVRRGTDLNAHLVLAIVLTVFSAIYWSTFAINAYTTFHDYTDLGDFALNMYYDVFYPSTTFHGLQVLVFGNHIAPDQLIFVLPFYYIFPSAITLIIEQAVVLSLTGLLIFFVARDLLKNDAIGLLFCIAYLLNPGIHGMVLFDYHPEFLIVPFYVLTFYYYMKMRRVPFLLSLILLLCTLEVAVSLTIFLGLGLMLYEVAISGPVKGGRDRLPMACAVIVVSIIFLLAYNIIYGLLWSSYGTAYATMPPTFAVTAYPLVPIFASNSFGGSFSLGNLALAVSSPLYPVYGIVIVFLGFGVFGLFVFVPFLLFELPWLFEGLFGKYAFFIVWYQYFAFALGGVIVAAILGAMRVSHKKMIDQWLIMSTVVLLVVITALYPLFVVNQDITSIGQAFLFQIPPQQQRVYAQLYSIMNLVPQNASLLTQPFVMPHVSDRRQLEVIGYSLGSTPFYFGPKYVLTDFNANISQNLFADGGMQYGEFKNITSQPQYILIAQNGTAMLYENES